MRRVRLQRLWSALRRGEEGEGPAVLSHMHFSPSTPSPPHTEQTITESAWTVGQDLMYTVLCCFFQLFLCVFENFHYKMLGNTGPSSPTQLDILPSPAESHGGILQLPGRLHPPTHAPTHMHRPVT